MGVEIKEINPSENVVRTLENGTSIIQKGGVTMHQCQYCDIWFTPNRRFIQKYCSESCRVMACKHRKRGLYGTMGGTMYDRNKVTNSEMYNMLETLQNEVKRLKSSKDTDQAIMVSKVDSIKKNQGWHMFMTCVMPVLAPKLAKGISNLFQNSTPADINEFRDKMQPLLKDVPEELQDQVLKAAKNYFTQEKKGKVPNPFDFMV